MSACPRVSYHKHSLNVFKLTMFVIFTIACFLLKMLYIRQTGYTEEYIKKLGYIMACRQNLSKVYFNITMHHNEINISLSDALKHLSCWKGYGYFVHVVKKYIFSYVTSCQQKAWNCSFMCIMQFIFKHTKVKCILRCMYNL